jgi:predicted nucleic acid-binding protein
VIEPIKVFLDASVLLAAAGSPDGGSSACLALLASGEYQPLVSAEVLREALGNLRLKFDRAAILRFYTQLAALQPTLVRPVAAQLPPSIAAKDHHVIQACLASGASICLTLDRRHLLQEEIRRWAIGRDFRLLSPGEFLAWERLRVGQSDS